MRFFITLKPAILPDILTLDLFYVGCLLIMFYVLKC